MLLMSWYLLNTVYLMVPSVGVFNSAMEYIVCDQYIDGFFSCCVLCP